MHAQMRYGLTSLGADLVLGLLAEARHLGLDEGGPPDEEMALFQFTTYHDIDLINRAADGDEQAMTALRRTCGLSTMN